MRELRVFILLVIANFFAQAIMSGDYFLAIERSYFEGIALLTYWLTKKIDAGFENE